jgi:molybdopterin-guanine dinucleotide biosynthesis protein MobB
VFSISGFSATGKTTLVEAIIPELMNRGYSVSSLKSSHHRSADKEMSDSLRHQNAGAVNSFFRGPIETRLKLSEFVIDTEDFLIVEGMKSSSLPKFWCIGNNNLGDTIPTNVKAIISWNPDAIEDKYGIPIISPDDIEQILSIILSEAIELEDTID